MVALESTLASDALLGEVGNASKLLTYSPRAEAISELAAEISVGDAAAGANHITHNSCSSVMRGATLTRAGGAAATTQLDADAHSNDNENTQKSACAR